MLQAMKSVKKTKANMGDEGARRSPIMQVAVFVGPSLEQAGRVLHPALTYLPPAARGDIAAASECYDSILLIDGVFHHDLAPAPKEVYAATQQVRMFGAASMGALRAAECYVYGMVPLGTIARWYVRGVIDGDDEVAVLVDPRTQTALTVPMVNVRYVIRLAQRQCLFNALEGAQVYERARNVYYMERAWTDVFAIVPSSSREAFKKLAEAHGNLKRHDALFALRSVLRRVERAQARANATA